VFSADRCETIGKGGSKYRWFDFNLAIVKSNKNPSYEGSMLMKFLMVSKSKHLVPPELMTDVIGGMKSWLQKYKGKIEQSWGFADTQGGGGILNVESLEELDLILTEFPMGPFSELDVHGLVALEPSLERLQIALQSMSSRG
jgi:muconolactone delta-isomerase